MFALDGKIAVVTGAGSGIGEAIARRLAAAGATPVLLDINDTEEEAARLGGMALKTDVSVESEVEAAAAAIADRYGRIDIAVNNAGIALEMLSITETTVEHFQRHAEVNTVGVLLGIKHFAPLMPAGSSITNTASILGVMAFPTYASYAASKHAVVGLTRVAAVDLGPRGIRVNCICPTSVNTPMLQEHPIGRAEATVLTAASTLEMIIEPDHAAALVHFLSADDCPVISGQPIMIDCGITAGIASGIWDGILGKEER